MDFKSVKDAFNDSRENERKRIIDFLIAQKDMNGRGLFTHVNGREYEDNGRRYSGGYGKSKYKGGGLAPPYDLTNWKYVETCYKNKVRFLISLQSFDFESETGNIHVLMDRIGIYKYNSEGKTDKILCIHKTDKITVADPFLKMKTTEIELPLDNEKLKKLVEILNEMSNC